MYTLTTIKQLLIKNIHVELICLNNSRIFFEAGNIGLVIHPINIAGKIHPFASLKTAILLKKGSYDLIHAQASKDLWVICPAMGLLKKKIPLIFTKHIGSYINKKDFLHKWLYKKVTFACAISNIIRKNLIDTCPINPERVILLHNGIDTNKFSPANGNRESIRKEFSILNHEILIGMLGRFSPGKGHEEFLASAKELNNKYSNLKFMVVGEASHGENYYETEIKNLSKKYDLNNIIFTGFRNDIAEILSAMDIFVFPSHSEAFGIALTEAMAMGLPSICANSAGILDIVVDRETSILFENRNSQDLALKIEELIVSPEKRSELGKGAIKRVLENFSLSIYTHNVINIYQKALNNPK